MNANELHALQGSVELRLFEAGHVIAVELCETRDEAEELALRWEDHDGITAVITDLSHEAEPDEPLAVDESDAVL